MGHQKKLLGNYVWPQDGCNYGLISVNKQLQMTELKVLIRLTRMPVGYLVTLSGLNRPEHARREDQGQLMQQNC